MFSNPVLQGVKLEVPLQYSAPKLKLCCKSTENSLFFQGCCFE